ncbi:unnamed protein product [Vitrella brassicaformis CCMP3155]|uniref:Uncharacterized protein n=2 Tax=Vitrella brassicaformis TaxID=1169539 RepID=A0A0G4GY65_VITBC|nr:unnamed protein product [Vitrella brassicaformis CCMP3155]|mmetsp:Transcript_4396/g.10110  ORF Transcript_4396/g.10110 Transcript_4396/m.10110 type:complete len:328 (+) Transcript_4396:153-1136(+)|eukprot:CEM36034.1 unnamed protein product [Vitrella brassicaformis CCMP3155]
MGCSSSRSEDAESSYRAASAKSDGEIIRFEDREGASDPLMPDPDFGWRRVPPANGGTNGVVPKPSKSLALPRSRGRGSASHHPSLDDPYTYIAFTNVRTGKSCSVSPVTLSINIAVRASRLATRFGIEVPTADIDTPPIYALLRVPSGYGWKLLPSPSPLAPQLTTGRRRTKAMSVGGVESPQTGLSPGISPRSSPDEAGGGDDYRRLVRMRQEGMPTVRTDPAEMAMNIHEQLFRLEGQSTHSHFLPLETFSWDVIRSSDPPNRDEQPAVQVRSPDGEACSVVPEEIMMNTVTWVVTTYLTQAPAFPQMMATQPKARGRPLTLTSG